MPTKYYKRQVNKDPKKHGPAVRWSEKQKYEAVALYKMVGSLRAAGASLGIPEETMRNWHQSDWWKQVEDEIATEARVKRSKKLDKLVDLATEIVADRLENGDWTYDAKSGTLKRKPVNALTASKVLQTAVDKQVLLENLARESKKQETQENLNNRLAFLMDEMLRFARSKEITAEVEHGAEQVGEREGGDPSLLPDEGRLLPVLDGQLEEEYDAVHDEREEGLQEGASLGEEDNWEGSPERSSGEESSSRSDDGGREGASGGREGC